MTRQSRVVHLDVQGEILVKSIVAQETDHGLGINIILMLCRLHRLRFDQEGTFETILTAIVASDRQHHRQMLFLPFHVRVQKAHITLTTTPENIVLTTKGDAGIDCVLNLRTSASDCREIGICRRTVHIALVAEDISRRP